MTDRQQKHEQKHERDIEDARQSMVRGDPPGRTYWHGVWMGLHANRSQDQKDRMDVERMARIEAGG